MIPSADIARRVDFSDSGVSCRSAAGMMKSLGVVLRLDST